MHSFIHSLSHSFIHSRSHSFIYSLSHSFTHYLIHSFTHHFIHSFTSSPSFQHQIETYAVQISFWRLTGGLFQTAGLRQSGALCRRTWQLSQATKPQGQVRGWSLDPWPAEAAAVTDYPPALAWSTGCPFSKEEMLKPPKMCGEKVQACGFTEPARALPPRPGPSQLPVTVHPPSALALDSNGCRHFLFSFLFLCFWF